MTETTFLADLKELEDWLTRINAPVPDIALPTVQRAIAQARTLAAIRGAVSTSNGNYPEDYWIGVKTMKCLVLQILDATPETALGIALAHRSSA